MSAFRLQARGVAGGLEQELTIGALQAFQQRYSTVQTRLHTEVLDSATQLLIDGSCTIGILSMYGNTSPALKRIPLLDIDLVMVAAPDHPLSKIIGPVSTDMLRDHVQLVLIDRSGLAGTRDYGVHSMQTWRLGDLGTILPMLRAGLGYGIMPEHLVSDDIAAGKLLRLVPQQWDGTARSIRLPIYAAWRADQPIGPAAQWLLDHLCSSAVY